MEDGGQRERECEKETENDKLIYIFNAKIISWQDSNTLKSVHEVTRYK